MKSAYFQVELTGSQAQSLVTCVKSQECENGMAPFLRGLLDQVRGRLENAKTDHEMFTLQGHVQRLRIILDLSNSISLEVDKERANDA